MTPLPTLTLLTVKLTVCPVTAAPPAVTVSVAVSVALVWPYVSDEGVTVSVVAVCALAPLTNPKRKIASPKKLTKLLCFLLSLLTSFSPWPLAK
ncbi:hypothetical protein COU00_00585 [Candidatus Falkowbacteria bacterium CG10_big_fil_rev_8_21_14_0_10_43_11]|uniref:Secreted protein n=1 Tax=Candidatus Falkowbacteria bacterium CG10_big_fil_rev_8_21_14_0_10_43_11 TaxID=1974568 RepID=A0A2M6WMY9_9BACT|nr:MAG: hypothetical protein COU00_00585 [Candidatus Falkowbacteria bacterium CG10_big_fil_rev_8_21_14_0_10_43_11]